MAAFAITNAAKADLKDIGRHTEKRWGREQRNVYLRMLDTTFQSITENPFFFSKVRRSSEAYCA